MQSGAYLPRCTKCPLMFHPKMVCSCLLCPGVPIKFIGPTHLSGRVEIYYNNIWGTVCDNGWDIYDARESAESLQRVCRELGYGAALTASHSTLYGEGSDQIWLDGVTCTGSESSLTMCQHRGFGTHSCTHAGVTCSGEKIDRFRQQLLLLIIRTIQ